MSESGSHVLLRKEHNCNIKAGATQVKIFSFDINFLDLKNVRWKDAHVKLYC